jgi:membrane-bound lytic murein transglycosylase D
MVMRRFLPLVIALVCGACASTAPTTAPVSPEASDLAATSIGDLRGLRADLQADYTHLLARESKPLDAPSVDVEAAASMDIPDNRFVRNAVTLFSGSLKNDIQTYLNRSARYKKMISKALAESGLPVGLAYLPVIESGYSLTMTSRAGARGMWQFMSDTAREYGLRVDWWVDERADPERATRAAALYIKDLYRQFNDWPLALAAYNAGPGRIRRAMESTSATSFWDLYEQQAVPKETRGYVPTFYATLIIASDPAAYGFQLSPSSDPSVKRVEVEGPFSLRYLGMVASVSTDVLEDLNPSLRRGIVPPGRTTIRVPASAAELVAAKAAKLRNDDAEVAVCSFRMRDGDSLRRIARAIGTNVDTIVAMNGLRSPSSLESGDSI